jgi:hypothetical protein
MLDQTRRFDLPEYPQARVYRDHQQERTYYVVPWSASIALDANGRPECRLLLFVKREQERSVATGGQLSLTATLSVADGDLARIKQTIEASLTPPPLPGEPPPEPVAIQLSGPDWASGRVSVNVVPGLLVTGQPSLSGSNRCALMSSLTADQARALQERWARGLPDARISYEMVMRVAESHSASGSARQETVSVGAHDVTGTSTAFDIDVHGTFADTQAIAIESPLRVNGLAHLVTEITL